MNALGVHSEVCQLRRAIVHRPGTELDRLTPNNIEDLRALELPAGSMGPKVEAACRFAERGGTAAIGRLVDAGGLVRGTIVIAEPSADQVQASAPELVAT